LFRKRTAWNGPVRRQGRGQRARPHAPAHRTTGPRGSVWRQDTLGNAMPVARRDREKTLPDAWWRGRIWRNGNYKHTAEAIACRKWIRQLIRHVKAIPSRLRQPWGPAVDAAEQSQIKLRRGLRARAPSLMQFNRQASLLHLEHYVTLAAHLCSFLDHHLKPRLLSATVVCPALGHQRMYSQTPSLLIWSGSQKGTAVMRRAASLA
jgi:hypothetical protein